ncbi:flagellar hook-basal body complex protein [Sporomusa aerivorans]|uniref:flagellar hook-basal body complex protein n=1 Tax=Sporomusa aerivorans TaxID=204936 RepID=UPI00352AEFED
MLADALKSATDAAVGNPTLAANVTAVYNAADDANTYTPTAQTAAANAVTTATANQSAAATAAATAATNQTAAATIAANAATVATKAAEAVKAAYDESSKVQTEVTVYDSQGNAYKLKGIFEKTADNTWTFTLGSDAVNADGDVIGTVSPTAVATLKFDSKGAYDSLNSVINSITIDPTGGPYAGAGSFTAKTDFSTMTQYASESTAKATAQNGWADGTLNGVTIDSTGTIVGNFTNGKTKDLARVAMAVFNNPAGLNKAGQNLYTESNNSGIADVGASGTGGRGTFTAGTLEMSNVDLSQEFSNMIITQRGFQANSKIITTSDEMLEILANLKR